MITAESQTPAPTAPRPSAPPPQPKPPTGPGRITLGSGPTHPANPRPSAPAPPPRPAKASQTLHYYVDGFPAAFEECSDWLAAKALPWRWVVDFHRLTVQLRGEFVGGAR